MRCVDTACDVEALYTTIVHTYGEFMMLGYQKRNFLQAVRSLSQRYHILREIYLKLMKAQEKYVEESFTVIYFLLDGDFAGVVFSESNKKFEV